MAALSNIILIDPREEKIEKIKFLNGLKSLKYYNLKSYRKIEDAIIEIKKIVFEETIIIINEKQYIEFVELFNKNLKDIYIIPKIIIYEENKENFIEKNKEYNNIINDPFYNSGGIECSIEGIKKIY